MSPEDLREFRRELGLSQERLAAALGVSMRAVQTWEGREHPIPPLLAPALEGVRKRLVKDVRQRGERARRAADRRREEREARRAWERHSAYLDVPKPRTLLRWYRKLQSEAAQEAAPSGDASEQRPTPKPEPSAPAPRVAASPPRREPAWFEPAHAQPERTATAPKRKPRRIQLADADYDPIGG